MISIAFQYQKNILKRSNTAINLSIMRLLSSTSDNNNNNKEEKEHYHLPVLLSECCDNLMSSTSNLNDNINGLYIDCTMGGGGHSLEILSRGGKVIGIDQDPDAILESSIKLKDYIDLGKMEIHKSNFRNIKNIVYKSKLAQNNNNKVDGILMDLGISSHQIDEASRGFAFSQNGPLDMRMNYKDNENYIDNSSNNNNNNNNNNNEESSSVLDANTIVNTWSEDMLSFILKNYGDEPRAKKIAREIIASRPISTTFELEDIISRITYHKYRTKTLARCFQAIRIQVNDEMGALEEALHACADVVAPGGRLVVMSYHSLEDKRVKSLMKTGSCDGSSSKNNNIHHYANNYNNKDGSFMTQQLHENQYEIKNIHSHSSSSSPELPWVSLYKKALIPSSDEIDGNSRARSAKLRVAVRTGPGINTDFYSKKNKYQNIMGEKQKRKATTTTTTTTTATTTTTTTTDENQ